MPRIRVFLAGGAIAAALITLGLRAQTVDEQFVVREGLGLPAVDIGVQHEESHTPKSAEALRRNALHAAIRPERVSSSGARYVPGRVIVKFRDDVSTGARLSAMSAASRTAAM